LACRQLRLAGKHGKKGRRRHAGELGIVDGAWRFRLGCRRQLDLGDSSKSELDAYSHAYRYL
jgi:hypothetical protein